MTNETEGLLKCLHAGINVDILRTDGRVHSAVISVVNLEQASVVVEWYEQGEAKGKEIDVKSLLEMNPSLNFSEMSQIIDEVDNDKSEPSTHCVSKADETIYNSPAKSTDAAFSLLDLSPLQEKIPAPNSPGNLICGDNISSPLNVLISKTLMQLGDFKKPEPTNTLSLRASASSTPSGITKPKVIRTSRKSISENSKIRRSFSRFMEDSEPVDPTDPNYEFIMMIRDYQRKIDTRSHQLFEKFESDNQKICVCVRKRPLNARELARKEIDVITVTSNEMMVVHEPRHKLDLTKYLENQQFRFDRVFDQNVSNETVYHHTARPLVECIFRKGMATCFAYGQTGSGKTHTMGGEFHSIDEQDCANGIYAFAARDVFNLKNTRYKKDNFRVTASFFEIYSGKVFDLLNNKHKLRVLEDHKGQVQIVGLKEEPVDSVEDVLRLLQFGAMERTSGQTSANIKSSRSHAVFQLILKRQNDRLHGKFSLIDLAGNERGADTCSANRLTRMEGAEINKSLLALKECIRALGRKDGGHLPFRVSKLTQVLRDSFMGDKSRTCMIAMISPSVTSCEHSLNTLRYADRVKELCPIVAAPKKPLSLFPSASLVTPLPPDGSWCAASVATSVNGDQFAPVSPLEEDQSLQSSSPSYQNSLTVKEAPNAHSPEHVEAVDSLSSEDVSEDWIPVHEVHNHTIASKELLANEHKTLLDNMHVWLSDHQKLYQINNKTNFDLEKYSENLIGLLGHQSEKLLILYEKMIKFGADLKIDEVTINAKRSTKSKSTLL